MIVLRRLLHGFFALAVLLGSLGAEPQDAAAPPHSDCCCLDESRCPCEPARLPEAPRRPCAPASPAAQAVLPAQAQAPLQRQAQLRPWEGLEEPSLAEAGLPDATPAMLPRDLPRPPDRSLKRLTLLSQFRI